MVRSYVTNPTTIKAMTEIPAKTPRPIGRTDNFFPGSSNAPVDAAAEVPPLAPELVAAGGADDGVVVVVGLVVEDDVVVVGAGVPVTVDNPLTTKPEDDEVEVVVVVVGVDVVIGELVVVDPLTVLIP